MDFKTGLSFDDILLTPERTEVSPKSVDTSTRITESIVLDKPLISSPMDRVTESEMAISMAVNGGLGIIHRNMSTEEQVEEVKKVKESQSWIIKNPETISPDSTVKEAEQRMEEKSISGLPVVENGKLKGILTSRDLRFENNLEKAVNEAMTERVVKSDPDTTMEEAKSILHKNKIEKLPLVEEDNKLYGLITIKDIEKNEKHPEATLDEKGRLMVGAAIGPGQWQRLESLVNAGIDLAVVDTSHGNSEEVINYIEEINESFDVCIMAGNVATEDGARNLAEAGADSIRVGIGPGSICTTRIVSGVGVPQVTATIEAAKGSPEDVSVVTDGGIRYSGDIAKSIACGADAAMLGNLLAGTDESPGRVVFREGRKYKEYRGMGSEGAMRENAESRYKEKGDKGKVPEGVEGLVPYKGKVSEVLHQLTGGVRSSMGHLGAKTIKEMKNANIQKITKAGKRESHPHNVDVMSETPRYSGEE